MIESKIELTRRLQREGRWHEASRFKDETITRLRAEGMKRNEAQNAAWEAMERLFPRAEDLTAAELDETPWEQFEKVPGSTPESYIQDSTWVYERLAVSGVKPSDAPTPGAWSLLQWARKHQDRFFEQIMPKVIAANQKKKPSSENGEWEAMDDLTEVRAMLQEARKNWDEAAMQNIALTIRTDVRSGIDYVKRMLNIEVPREFYEELTIAMKVIVVCNTPLKLTSAEFGEILFKNTKQVNEIFIKISSQLSHFSPI